MFGRIIHPKNWFNRAVAESTVKAEHRADMSSPTESQPPVIIIDNKPVSEPKTQA